MKKSPKTRVLLLGVSSLCMLTIPQFAFANTTNSNTSNADLFPLTPRISGLGLAGTDEVVAGDAMAALVGNENGIWWLDGQGKTAFENAWVGSLGTGFRVVQDNKRVLGAYVFGDRNISGNNTDFWFVSPGVESLGQVFDFRVNGYIPVGDQRKLTGTGFADTFGNYDYVTFQGHQQLDAIVNNYEMTGWGIDGEVGVRVPGWYGTRVYAGGYHFDQDHADAINGVAARVEYPINANLALNVRDSYDNTQHNTIEVGLQVNLGGVNKNPRERDQPIRERLLDPVSRNLATLGQGTAEPIGNEQVVVNNGNNPTPPLEVERDNIWFFSPTGTDTFTDATSCTADNVCASNQLTQATIDAINAGPTGATINPTPSADPSFYLASGTTYNFNTSGTPFTLTDDLFYGRSSDFVMDQQVTVQGAAILNGTDILSYLTFQYDPAFLQTQQIGLMLNANSDVTMVHTIVGADNSAQGYFTGVDMTNATLTANTNSEIHAFSDDPTKAPIGINTHDTTTSVINLTDTVVNSTADLSAAPGSDPYIVYGIKTDNVTGANITLNNSTVDAIVDTTGVGGVLGTTDAEGIYVAHSTGTTANDAITLTNKSVVAAKAINFSNLQLTATGINFADQNASSNLMIDDSTVIAKVGGVSDVSNATGVLLGAISPTNTVNIQNGAAIIADVESRANVSSTATGVLVSGTTDTVNINGGSSINAFNNAIMIGGTAEATGLNVSASGPSNVTITMNNGFVNSEVTIGNAEGLANGIVVTSPSNGTVKITENKASKVTASATTTGVGDVTSNGINVSGGASADISLDGSFVTANATGDGANAFSSGILVDAVKSTTISLTNKSNVDSTSNLSSAMEGLTNQAYGILVENYQSNGTNKITVDNSTVNATGNAANAFLSQVNSIYMLENFGITGVTNTVNLTNATLNATSTIDSAISGTNNFFDTSNVTILDDTSTNTVNATGGSFNATATLGEAGVSNKVEMTTTNVYIPSANFLVSAIDKVDVTGGVYNTSTTVNDGQSAPLNITAVNFLVNNNNGGSINITVDGATLNDDVTLIIPSSNFNDVFEAGVRSDVFVGSGVNNVKMTNDIFNLSATIGGMANSNLFQYGSYANGGTVTNTNTGATFNPTTTGTWGTGGVTFQQLIGP